MKQRWFSLFRAGLSPMFENGTAGVGDGACFVVHAAAEPGEASGSCGAAMVADVPLVPVRGTNRWIRLVKRIQSGKRWSDWGRMQNYAVHGMPKNLDDPPTGFGKHLGRWGWREITYHW